MEFDFGIWNFDRNVDLNKRSNTGATHIKTVSGIDRTTSGFFHALTLRVTFFSTMVIGWSHQNVSARVPCTYWCLNTGYYNYSTLTSCHPRRNKMESADDSGASSYWLPSNSNTEGAPQTPRLDKMFVTLPKSLFLARYDIYCQSTV